MDSLNAKQAADNQRQKWNARTRNAAEKAFAFLAEQLIRLFARTAMNALYFSTHLTGRQAEKRLDRNGWHERYLLKKGTDRDGNEIAREIDSRDLPFVLDEAKKVFGKENRIRRHLIIRQEGQAIGLAGMMKKRREFVRGTPLTISIAAEDLDALTRGNSEEKLKELAKAVSEKLDEREKERVAGRTSDEPGKKKEKGRIGRKEKLLSESVRNERAIMALRSGAADRIISLREIGANPDDINGVDCGTVTEQAFVSRNRDMMAVMTVRADDLIDIVSPVLARAGMDASAKGRGETATVCLRLGDLKEFLSETKKEAAKQGRAFVPLGLKGGNKGDRLSMDYVHNSADNLHTDAEMNMTLENFVDLMTAIDRKTEGKNVSISGVMNPGAGVVRIYSNPDKLQNELREEMEPKKEDGRSREGRGDRQTTSRYSAENSPRKAPAVHERSERDDKDERGEK